MASLAEMAAQSNQIAQQNNPNFAALNTLVQGRTIPLNGFSDFLQKTIEPAKQRRHEASENLLNRQHQSAENEQNRRHNFALENLRNSLAKDLEAFRHNYNKDLLKLQHSNTLTINDRNQNDMLERLAFQHRLNLDNKNYDIKREDDLYDRALSEKYYGLGGLDNLKNISTGEKLQKIYTLEQQRQNNPKTFPTLNFSKVSENTTTPTTIPAQNSILDLPTYNNSGRITIDDLPQISKLYPYLYQTNEGKFFLDRLEQAINQNPEDRRVLLPFLEELQSGKIPLIAPIKKADRTPYDELRPYDEQVVSDINKSLWNVLVPARFGSYLAKGTDDGARLLENQAIDYGFAPERKIKKNYDGLFGRWDRFWDNMERSDMAKDYMEKFIPVYTYLNKNNMKRVQVSPDDQVTNHARIIIAKNVGLPSPFDVQVYRNNFGALTFVADGQMFEIDKTGEVFKVEP